MAKKKTARKRWIRLLLCAIIAFAGYLIYLDITVRSKFEAHRWNLPSRVYAEASYLYPGQKLSLPAFEEALERLNYKKVVSMVEHPGEFFVEDSSVAVYLRDFAYPSENFASLPVRVSFAEGEIASLSRIEAGEAIKALKLEPELIASIFDEKMEDRTLITLDRIPKELVAATVTVEDERFYNHFGIDPIGILRALVTDILHLKLVQGGSTLTQQLVKNFFLSSERSFIRKFNEVWMALLLELHYSKEEILEAYFNEIYFGQRGAVSVTGVEEASKLYFAKSAADLSLSESALLAGMIRSPGHYSPFRNLKRAYERRNLVLKKLLDAEKISKASYASAKSETIRVPEKNDRVLQAPFFIDFVQRQLKESYPSDVLKSEGLRIFTTLDLKAQEIAEAAVSRQLDSLEKSKPKLKANREKSKALEGILLAVQPQTGSIRAFVGGRQYGASQFNRITDAHRQPGSAFKPFVYLTAFEEHPKEWTAASLIEDRSFSVALAGKDWTPKNYDNKEHGEVTVREALANSYNLSAVKLALDVGLDDIISLANDAGIESELKPYPSLALGAFEVTPLELIRAYTVFPNQGTRSEPIAIKSVMTRDGEVLEKKSYRIKKVVSPESAYLINRLMRGVLDGGTAASARTLGFTGMAAGKTGTTSDYRDSWFVGYTPDLLALSWVGYDDNTPTGLSGSSGALPIWAEFMRKVNPKGASQEDFTATDDIILMKVDSLGKLYREKCDSTFTEEAFINGTQPKEYCD